MSTKHLNRYVQTLKSSNKQQSSYPKKQTLHSTIRIHNRDYNVYKDMYGFKVIRESDKQSIRIKDEKDVTQSNIEDLFRYPIVLGKFNENNVVIKKGPYGLYQQSMDKMYRFQVIQYS